MVWVYLGPPEKQPRFPAYDWLGMPSEQRVIIKQGQRSNYLQGLEGSIDSSHSWFLHRGSAPDWEKRMKISADVAPRLEAEDTDYGFRYAAIRKPNDDPDKQKYVRVTNWALPYVAFIPRPMDNREVLHVAIHVPIDDHHTMFYGIFASQDGSRLDLGEWRERMHAPGDRARPQLDSLRRSRQPLEPGSRRVKHGTFPASTAFRTKIWRCPGEQGNVVPARARAPRDLGCRDHPHAPSHDGVSSSARCAVRT